jgi:hypothetical protein
VVAAKIIQMNLQTANHAFEQQPRESANGNGCAAELRERFSRAMLAAVNPRPASSR